MDHVSGGKLSSTDGKSGHNHLLADMQDCDTSGAEPGDSLGFTGDAWIPVPGVTHKQTFTGPPTTSSTWVITHELGTRDVVVDLYGSGDYGNTAGTIKRTDAYTVTITFATAAPANSRRVTIIG